VPPLGAVYFADDLGHCSDVVHVGSPIKSMYFSHEKDYLVIVTDDVVLYKFRIAQDGRIHPERKVKLAVRGDGSELQCIWAGPGLLAAANCEPLLRLWHLERDENYTLLINDPRHGAAPKDLFRCVAFNPRSQVLASGTTQGRVCMWKFVGSNDGKEASEADWDILPSVDGLKHCSELEWGPGEQLLGVTSRESASILNETTLHCKLYGGLAAVQTSADKLFLHTAEGQNKRISSSIRVKGLDVNDKYVVVWNGKKVEVRESKQGSIGICSTFNTKAAVIALSGEDLYAVVGQNIEVFNLQGVQKKSLAFSELQGSPRFLNISGNYLACVRTDACCPVWCTPRCHWAVDNCKQARHHGHRAARSQADCAWSSHGRILFDYQRHQAQL